MTRIQTSSKPPPLSSKDEPSELSKLEVVQLVEIGVLDARRARVKALQVSVAGAAFRVVVVVVDLRDPRRIAGQSRAAQAGAAEQAPARVAAEQAAKKIAERNAAGDARRGRGGVLEEAPALRLRRAPHGPGCGA